MIDLYQFYILTVFMLNDLDGEAEQDLVIILYFAYQLPNIILYQYQNEYEYEYYHTYFQFQVYIIAIRNHFMNRLNKIGIFNKFNSYRVNMKAKRQQNIILLRSYMKKQRQVIINKTINKIIKGVLWTALLSASYYYVHQIYSQKLQVRQMKIKLSKIYPNLCTIIKNTDDHQLIYIKPQYNDQLANIISMCWKYHFKMIINNEDLGSFSLGSNINQFTKDIPEQIRNKCIFVNISNLKNAQIQQINHVIGIECGSSCKSVNQLLKKRGYDQIFLKQLDDQKVYDVIVNNYPLNSGSITAKLNSLQIVSPEGEYFVSTNKNTKYGQIPNLNSLFIGSGGIFGIPIKLNLFISHKKPQQTAYCCQIGSNDLNQKILVMRSINQFLSKNHQKISLKISKNSATLKQKLTFTNSSSAQEDSFQNILIQLKKQVPALTQIAKTQQKLQQNYNILFNVSQSTFQQFILSSNNQLSNISFDYTDNLLKLKIENNKLMNQIVSQLTLQNSALIWCADKKYLRQIKRSTDETEVGAELMKKLVQIRQGLDHKKIIYNHNRYEQYFSKGMFRKLTQIFW